MTDLRRSRPLSDTDPSRNVVAVSDIDLKTIDQLKREQQMSALEKANAVRKRNALVRDLLRQRKLNPVHMIAGTLEGDLAPVIEEAIRPWKLMRVLVSVPGIGEARAMEILYVFQATPTTRVKQLTYARRAELANLVRIGRMGHGRLPAQHPEIAPNAATPR